jgi:hypothetical protein
MYIYGTMFFGDIKVLYSEKGLCVFSDIQSEFSERLRDCGLRWNEKKNSMFISNDKPLRIEAAFDILSEYKKEYLKTFKEKKEQLKQFPIKSHENIEIIDRRDKSHGFIVIFKKYDKNLFSQISMVTGSLYNQITYTWHIPTDSVEEFNDVINGKIKKNTTENVIPIVLLDHLDGKFKIRILKNDNNISIYISNFKDEHLHEIKKIKGVRFDKNKKCWNIPISEEKEIPTLIENMKLKQQGDVHE